MALQVLAIARLLADEHDRRAQGPLPEDRLRGVAPQRAFTAAGRLATQPLEGVFARAGAAHRDISLPAVARNAADLSVVLQDRPLHFVDRGQLGLGADLLLDVVDR